MPFTHFFRYQSAPHENEAGRHALQHIIYSLLYIIVQTIKVDITYLQTTILRVSRFDIKNESIPLSNYNEDAVDEGLQRTEAFMDHDGDSDG